MIQHPSLCLPNVLSQALMTACNLLKRAAVRILILGRKTL